MTWAITRYSSTGQQCSNLVQRKLNMNATSWVFLGVIIILVVAGIYTLWPLLTMWSNK